MACILSTGYTQSSSCEENNFPGISRIWIGNRSEITAIATNASGQITGTTGSANAYLFDVVEDSGQVLQNGQVGSTKFFTETLNFQLQLPTNAQRDTLSKLLKARTFAIVEQGDSYYFLGQYGGGLKTAQLDVDSGTTADSFAGVTISLAGRSFIVAREITQAAVTALTS